MTGAPLPPGHPHRVALHNEIHARPPEALEAPLALSRVVMFADAAQRQASREHVAALLREHHQPLPDANGTYVRAELPGVNRDDINVEVVDDYLTITAARKTPAADGKGEESFSFSRSVSLNGAVQADKVSATYENGVLTVTLPKREEAKPKKITVAVK